MGGEPRGKWHPNRLWCFARRATAHESDEQWTKAPSNGRRSKNKDLSKAQSAQIFSRDSEDGLRAYLGQGQLQRPGSVSVLSKAAYTAEMERRLKGLPVDESFSPVDAMDSTAARNLGCSELGLNALIAAEQQPKPVSGTQPSPNTRAIADPPSEAARDLALAKVLPVSPFCQDPNLEAAEDAQMPLSTSATDKEISSVTQEKQFVGTPPRSDRLRPPMTLTSCDGSSAFCTSSSLVSQRLEGSHAYSSSKSYSGPECAEESSNVSYRSQEVLTEDDEGTASACLEGTTELTLAPSSRVNTTSFIIRLSRDLLPELLEAKSGEPEQQPQRVLRAQTMPHISSSLKDSLTSVASTTLTRRHTAVVLISTSDDEDENEVGRTGIWGGGEFAQPCTKKLQRSISDVYEGHHVQLQKLRKQMGNPGEPADDLLAVVARRIFTQQSPLSRTESEALASASQQSSPAVEAGLSDTSGWYSPKLPPIKTRVE